MSEELTWMSCFKLLWVLFPTPLPLKKIPFYWTWYDRSIGMFCSLIIWIKTYDLHRSIGRPNFEELVKICSTARHANLTPRILWWAMQKHLSMQAHWNNTVDMYFCRQKQMTKNQENRIFLPQNSSLIFRGYLSSYKRSVAT